MRQSRCFRIGQGLLALVCLSSLSACVTTQALKSNPLAAGDTVTANYTCRLNNGFIAATTFQKVGDAVDLPKSSIFAPPQKYGPVNMQAGKESECKSCEKDLRHFTLVLEESIQKELPGVYPGTTFTLQVKTDEELMDEKTGTLRMSRRQSRPKIKPVESSRIVDLLGRMPEIGERVQVEQSGAIPFTIIESNPPALLIEYDVEINQPYKTPFGTAKIDTIDENNFWITITPEKNYLIRSGGLVGRVVDFDEAYMTLDYRNPFGYEELNCDVEVVELITPAADNLVQASATGNR